MPRTGLSHGPPCHNEHASAYSACGRCPGAKRCQQRSTLRPVTRSLRRRREHPGYESVRAVHEYRLQALRNAAPLRWRTTDAHPADDSHKARGQAKRWG